MQHVQLEAAKIVGRVIKGRNLSQVLSESLHQQNKYTPQQRGALQDLSYGTLRHYTKLTSMLGKLMQHPSRDVTLHNLLLVALYQLLFSKAGQYVVVDQAVRASKQLNAKSAGLVNGVLRNFLRQQEVLEVAANNNEISRYSFPQWWIDRIKKQYGEFTASILEASNQHPPMTLRVNIKKTTVREYKGLLEQEGFSSLEVGAEGLVLNCGVAVDRLPKFNEGWVSVQDAGAQYAAHLLDVRDGMQVLDACAAPGGKTAHLLELAGIELVAVDKDKQRLARVKENLWRLQLNAHVKCGDAATPDSWWDGKPFHRILADVPCSASGVVRRHPDIKWLRRPSDIEMFAIQQEQILAALWPLLEKGGKLLYVTCSIFERENHRVIKEFISRHLDVEQEKIELGRDGQLLPDEMHDGFYYALLRKKS